VTASGYTRRLFLTAENPWRALAYRLLIVLALTAIAWLMLWIERDGLKDSRGLPITALDVLYFAIVTVTTLGYGDIVPVSPEARSIVAFGITPLRAMVWIVLVSTAYELVLRRSVEKIELERLKRSLNDHVVICGFGVKGQSAVRELVERGRPASQIVVIDRDPKAIEQTERLGVTFILGNASSEDILRDAAIDKAAEAIVVPNNDEACVLIVLTVREIAPKVKIRAAAREDENVKLIRRSGADTVIAPSVDGGRLLASATVAPHATDMMEELLEHGRGVDIIDYNVPDAQAGLLPAEVPELKDKLVLAVRSVDGQLHNFQESKLRPLHRGDTVIAWCLPNGK